MGSMGTIQIVGVNINVTGGAGAVSPGSSAGNMNQGIRGTSAALSDAKLKGDGWNKTMGEMGYSYEHYLSEKAAEANTQTMQLTRSMTMLSISIFVSVLIIRQMTSAIVGLGKMMGLSKEDAAELNKTVTGLNAVMGLAMGPLQLYIMWTMIAQSSNAALANSFIALGASIGAVFAIVGFMSAESNKLKAAYLALIAVTLSLALAQAILAANKYMNLQLSPATMLIAPIALGLALGGAAAVMALSRGETSEGSYRTVERSGPIYAHAGEKLGRITAQNGTQSGGGNRSITIISNDPYRTAKMIERYDRRNLGKKRIKRAVA
jgi:hypothetical protein